jgi:hypothetical protein
VKVDGDTEPLAGLWPLFGLLIQTPALRLRLPREAELPALARAARDIAGPGEPRLQMSWMYDDSPAMERQLLQRHWRALAHWRPESWHLLLAIFADGEPIGIQGMWADDFARCRSVGTTDSTPSTGTTPAASPRTGSASAAAHGRPQRGGTASP